MSKVKQNTVFYNHGKEPIYISTKITPDPNGGPGIVHGQMIIRPGQGIDLAILNLKPEPVESKGGE